MLTVGLTGNIASGKSAVAKVWRSLGAHVVDADELARRAVLPGSLGLEEIVRLWGKEILLPDGQLDRAALRQIVFRDSGARKRLEQIIHPEVATLRDRELERLRAEGASIAVADVPLLYEVGLQDEFDRIVLVHAPDELRRARIVRDRGISAEEAQRIMNAQMPSEKKKALADMVIENDGTLADLEAAATRAWRSLTELAAARASNGG